MALLERSPEDGLLPGGSTAGFRRAKRAAAGFRLHGANSAASFNAGRSVGRDQRARPVGGPWGQLPPLGYVDPRHRIAEIRATFRGLRLADLYEMSLERSSGSKVYRIVQRSFFRPVSFPSAEVVRTALLSRLDLVHGIGGHRWEQLATQGVRTMSDLADPDLHPTFASEAAGVLDEIEADDLLAICARLRRRQRGLGHLLATLLAGSVELEEIAFVDTETLGLDNNMIFLVGIGRFGTAGFTVEQFLAPRHCDEAAILQMSLHALRGARVLVTYNGSSADVPWLQNRCFYHGLKQIPELAHLDLIHGTRRRYLREQALLPDARLPTVQTELLGMRRPTHDVPSYVIPELYDTYVSSPDAEGMLIPVIDHNFSDVETLTVLLEKLSGEALEVCPRPAAPALVTPVPAPAAMSAVPAVAASPSLRP